MTPPKKTARMAGLLYLILAITGGFGIMYIPTAILVPTDAVTTAQNILENEGLFRLSIFSQLVSQSTFVFLVLALFRLFKDVDLKIARSMVALVVVAVPIALLNALNHVIALRLLNGEPYLNAFEPAELQALMMAFLNLSNDGVAIAQIFWGLWLFPFGILVIRSGFIPTWIGYLLIIACFGYLAGTTAHFLLPSYEQYVGFFTAAAGTIGELSIILWLLIKGTREIPEPGISSGSSS
jgi:hypothetical protein